MILITTIVLGLIGIIIFEKIQKNYKTQIDIYEITKNLPSLNNCIKNRQCLYQIKNKNYNLNKINTDNTIYDKQLIGKFLIKLRAYCIDNSLEKINIVTNNNNYSINQNFQVIDQDTTFIEKTHWMLIYLQEIDKPIETIYDTIYIDYTYDFNLPKKGYFFNDIKFTSRKILEKFNIDSIKISNNLITINVSKN